jgi:hypothetical protein
MNFKSGQKKTQAVGLRCLLLSKSNHGLAAKDWAGSNLIQQIAVSKQQQASVAHEKMRLRASLKMFVTVFGLRIGGFGNSIFIFADPSSTAPFHKPANVSLCQPKHN